MRRFAVLVALAAALAASCTRPPSPVQMATTTSVENTGLLAAILPEFEKEAGVTVQAVAVGSGRALDILDRRDADLALIHDPIAERAYKDRGVFGDYRKIMYNDFVIAGPEGDPAKVREAASAVEAMTRLAKSTSSFASRADNSGTHSRELQLWKAAGRKPEGALLVETGQGMAATLRIASERQLYVLTDRSTFALLAPTLKLTILTEGDPVLLNTYAIVYRSGLTADRLDNAKRFVTWIADGRGRDLIASFEIRGARTFTVWPAGRPGSNPEDRPHDP